MQSRQVKNLCVFASLRKKSGVKHFKAIAAMALNRVIGAGGGNSICVRCFGGA
jgi:hypothetical protein